jgi:hypothetical protein
MYSFENLNDEDSLRRRDALGMSALRMTALRFVGHKDP